MITYANIKLLLFLIFRRYLPVLKDMPLRYLFEPWKAPLPVQEKAKCIVGEDYPFPIVNHKEASNECAKRMKSVVDNFRGKGKMSYYNNVRGSSK